MDVKWCKFDWPQRCPQPWLGNSLIELWLVEFPTSSTHLQRGPSKHKPTTRNHQAAWKCHQVTSFWSSQSTFRCVIVMPLSPDSIVSPSTRRRPKSLKRWRKTAAFSLLWNRWRQGFEWHPTPSTPSSDRRSDCDMTWPSEWAWKTLPEAPGKEVSPGVSGWKSEKSVKKC